ncbi:MAG: host attachment protein [Rhodospirillales bacterium]|nr:host attachment protein [Rhodospirillales bacterium]
MLANKRTIWAVVADGARAHILEHVEGQTGWHAVFAHDFAAPARAHTSQAMSDRQGRAFDSTGSARHALQPRTDWQRQTKRIFAAQVAEALNEAARDEAFQDLVLVAPAKALGDLRAQLGKAAKAKLVLERTGEFTHLAEHALSAELDRIVTPA